jgi:hypothetical protein
MMDVSIEIKGLQELMDRFGQFDEIAVGEFRAAMGVSVETVAKLAREKAPRNLSYLVGSITGKVQGGGVVTQVEGVVGAYKPYAQVMEEGADPHWPNMGNLHYWVVRKLGLNGVEAERATFLIARAISRRGLKGRHYMRDGLKEAEPKIKAEFEQAVERVVQKLTGDS